MAPRPFQHPVRRSGRHSFNMELSEFSHKVTPYSSDSEPSYIETVKHLFRKKRLLRKIIGCYVAVILILSQDVSVTLRLGHFPRVCIRQISNNWKFSLPFKNYLLFYMVLQAHTWNVSPPFYLRDVTYKA